MAQAAKPNCQFKDAKVLVAEDDEFSLEVLKYMLSVYGITADQAVDGVETIERVKQKDYDLLILDIHMPHKDGNQAVREIREMEIKQPVIVALTASVFKAERETSIAAGFDDCFNKPLDISGIEKIIKKYLKSKQISVEL